MPPKVKNVLPHGMQCLTFTGALEPLGSHTFDSFLVSGLIIQQPGVELAELLPNCMASCNLWLHSKPKEPLTGNVFKTCNELIQDVHSELDKLTKADFMSCFYHWIKLLKSASFFMVTTLKSCA